VAFLFYLASLAGLFPGLTLPLAFGWKALSAFDLIFAAGLAVAAHRRAVRPADVRLLFAGAAAIAAGVVCLWINPSPRGPAAVASIAYSVVVLLAVAHLRIDQLQVRVDRAILGALALALALAWVVLLVENLTDIDVGRNRSPMLPAAVHRLGGFTGGNVLILFLALAAPLVRGPSWVLLVVLPSALATLSRSILGVGVGLALGERSPETTPRSLGRMVKAGAWSCIAVGVVFYLVAVIPVVRSERTGRVSLEPGGYLTPHIAALRMLASSPLVGVGPSGFPERFVRFTSDEERRRLPPSNRPELAPHSAILGVAAEQGLLGLGALAWLLFEIFARLSRIEDPRLRTGAIAGLFGLLVAGHFVDWLTLKGLWLWIGLLVASRKTQP